MKSFWSKRQLHFSIFVSLISVFSHYLEFPYYPRSWRISVIFLHHRGNQKLNPFLKKLKKFRRLPWQRTRDKELQIVARGGYPRTRISLNKSSTRSGHTQCWWKTIGLTLKWLVNKSQYSGKRKSCLPTRSRATLHDFLIPSHRS